MGDGATAVGAGIAVAVNDGIGMVAELLAGGVMRSLTAALAWHQGDRTEAGLQL